MKLRLLQLLVALSAALALAGAFMLGRASGARSAQQAEYERVVLQVAEAYGRDPSEIEVECGLTDASGRIVR